MLHAIHPLCVVQGKSELVFFDRELKKVNSLPVADCVGSLTSPPLISLLFRLLCLLSHFFCRSFRFFSFSLLSSSFFSLSRLNLDFSYPSLSSLTFHFFFPSLSLIISLLSKECDSLLLASKTEPDCRWPWQRKCSRLLQSSI